MFRIAVWMLFLLGLAILFLRIRNLFGLPCDCIYYDRGDHLMWCCSFEGQIIFVSYDGPASYPPEYRGFSLSAKNVDAVQRGRSSSSFFLLKSFAGFGCNALESGGFVVAAPHWFLAAILLVPGLLRFGMFVLAWRRRRKIGCCRNCGYDLRATPERCPECGTVATEADAINRLIDRRVIVDLQLFGSRSRRRRGFPVLGKEET